MKKIIIFASANAKITFLFSSVESILTVNQRVLSGFQEEGILQSHMK
jgi:hypothetical protein